MHWIPVINIQLDYGGNSLNVDIRLHNLLEKEILFLRNIYYKWLTDQPNIKIIKLIIFFSPTLTLYGWYSKCYICNWCGLFDAERKNWNWVIVVYV